MRIISQTICINDRDFSTSLGQSVRLTTLNNPEWRRNFPDPSKTVVLQLKAKYLLKYSSPTNDSWRVRERTIRAFNLIFELLGWGPAIAALAPDFAPKLCTPRVILFSFFVLVFSIFETSSQQSVKMRAMLCDIVWKSYSRVFFTIRSAGAFRNLQILSGAKTYHNAI